MKIFSLLVLILELATAWKVFEKYGEPGWKGLIPIYSDMVEYGKVWIMPLGIVSGVISVYNAVVSDSKVTALAVVLGLINMVISIIFASKKSKAFGKGLGMTLVLIFFPFIGNLYIGFNDSVRYRG